MSVGALAPAQNASTAAIRLDAQGRICDATALAAAMLGFAPQDLRGRSLRDLAIDGWQAAAELASARVRFGATDSFELALKGRSGRRTLVEMTARAGADASDGALIAWSERRMRRGASGPEADPKSGRLTYGLLSGQEMERRNVACQLHDEVAPVVVMAKYLVEDTASQIEAGVAGDCLGKLRDAAQRLREVISELLRISTDLRPKLLDDLGLLATLEWYGRGVEQAHPGLRVVCHLQVAEDSIPLRLKLEIFRIVQEALRNAVQHAQAHRLQVNLYATATQLCLIVEDDGHGFDPLLATSGDEAPMSGLGLQSMRGRAQETGGRMLLDAAPGRGTRIGAAWPLDRTQEL
jgi:two-component system NarL family sensor kinase